MIGIRFSWILPILIRIILLILIRVVLPVDLCHQIDAGYPAPPVPLPWEAPEVIHVILLLLLLSLLLLLLLLLLILLILLILRMWILPANLRDQIDAVYPAPLVPLPWKAPEVIHVILLLLLLTTTTTDTTDTTTITNMGSIARQFLHLDIRRLPSTSRALTVGGTRGIHNHNNQNSSG